jgi:crossover junction endodeoxyribonuclease RuvC
MACEELFFNTNQETAIAVAEARGVILLAAMKKNLDFYEYTPHEVKQSVVGYGRADKHQVMQMVKIFLHLEKVPKLDDTADALALAICHAHASESRMQGYYNLKKEKLL